jgi:septum formation protein
MRLILASASPSRLRLLRAAGIDPEVVVSAVDEDELTDAMPEATPEELARVLAQAAAIEVQHRIGPQHQTVREPRGDVARVRAHELRGRSADLITGQCLIHPGGEEVASARTTVHFAFFDDAEIDAYVATGEPLNVAGGFTLDGYGSAFVRRVDGDPANVIGLGIPLLRDMVRRAGYSWTGLWSPGLGLNQ